MSVIAVRKHDKGIEIGFDQWGNHNNHGAPDIKDKVYSTSDGVWVGYSGKAFEANMIRTELEEENFGLALSNPMSTDRDLYSWGLQKRMDRILKRMRELKGEDYWWKGRAIFVRKQKAFLFEDGSVYEINDYWAIGSGGQVAMGALSINSLMKEAIQAAINTVPTCGGEPRVVGTFRNE